MIPTEQAIAIANCVPCSIRMKPCDYCNFKGEWSMARTDTAPWDYRQERAEGYVPEKKSIFYLSNKVVNRKSQKMFSINRNGKMKFYYFDMRRGEQIRRRLDDLVANERGAIFGLSTYSFIN